MVNRKLLVLVFITLLLSACSSADNFIHKTIENSLDKEIDIQYLTEISTSDYDIAIYCDSEKVHLYIFRDFEFISGDVYRKEDILNENFIWAFENDKINGIYALWGGISNLKSSYLLFNGEFFQPNIINLGEISLFYEFYDNPPDYPIDIIYKSIE